MQEIQNATSLEDLYNRLVEADTIGLENVDLTYLPTFGGEAPNDTRGVWSWDATHAIVGEGGVKEWKIVRRAEWFDGE